MNELDEFERFAAGLRDATIRGVDNALRPLFWCCGIIAAASGLGLIVVCLVWLYLN